VLYLDRPGSKPGSGAGLCGRFRYNDLKEAASSGAADLWALNRPEAFPVGRGPLEFGGDWSGIQSGLDDTIIRDGRC
jgi:hypothetical protein